MRFLKLMSATAVLAGLALTSVTAHGYAVTKSFKQAESTDAHGKITVEASVINVITCSGARENGGQFYIYRYTKRHGYRAIKPPDWGHAIGGRDFGTLREAAKAACALAPGEQPPKRPTKKPTKKPKGHGG